MKCPNCNKGAVYVNTHSYRPDGKDIKIKFFGDKPIDFYRWVCKREDFFCNAYDVHPTKESDIVFV